MYNVSFFSVMVRLVLLIIYKVRTLQVITVRAQSQGQKKKCEFQLVLWVKSSHILLAWDHFFLIFVNDFVVDDLPGPLPIWQTSKLYKLLGLQENLLVPDYWAGLFFQALSLYAVFPSLRGTCSYTYAITRRSYLHILFHSLDIIWDWNKVIFLLSSQ